MLSTKLSSEFRFGEIIISVSVMNIIHTKLQLIVATKINSIASGSISKGKPISTSNRYINLIQWHIRFGAFSIVDITNTPLGKAKL